MAEEEQINDMENLREACLATLAAMNEMLANQYPDLDPRLGMVRAQEAKKLRKVFAPFDRERQVDWDWEQLFHKRVKRDKTAWMFLVSVAQAHGAVCYGTVSVEGGCVSIERLERNIEAPKLKGLAALIAIQYAEALATYLALGEVRVCDPDPALVPFYEQNFGLTRHSKGKEVTYLFKRMLP